MVGNKRFVDTLEKFNSALLERAAATRTHRASRETSADTAKACATYWKERFFRTVLCALAIPIMGGCHTQLPNRSDGLTLDVVPNLDATLISSNNGLLSTGITNVPGSYCIPGSDGKCDANALSPAQCLTAGATILVAPKTNPTPSYDALIDNKYTATLGGVPFINATGSAETLDEVKAVISGTAEITGSSPNNGYPGVEGLKACILKNQGPGTYNVVYWISAANILDVTINHFAQVSSTEGVTATAFGLNGTTYNHNGVTEEKIWIGLQAAAIHVGQVSAGAPAAAGAPEARPSVTSAAFVR